MHYSVKVKLCLHGWVNSLSLIINIFSYIDLQVSFKKMPVHKDVVTLSNLCVQKIAQLFIDITKCLNQCSDKKKKKALASQKTEEREIEQKCEEHSKENTAIKTKILKIKIGNSSKPELQEDNGHTQTTAEYQTEESPASLNEEEDEEKRKKKQEG